MQEFIDLIMFRDPMTSVVVGGMILVFTLYSMFIGGSDDGADFCDLGDDF